MKILFITANRVGDAVLSTGLLAWLVEKYPGAQITIACGPYAAGLFRAVPGLERLIVLEKKSWNRHWLALWRICIGTQWDLIVDLRDSIVSRLLRAGKRVSPPHNTGRHKVIENAVALNTLSREAGEGGAQSFASANDWEGEGIVTTPPSPASRERKIPAPHIWLDQKAEKEAAQLLEISPPPLGGGREGGDANTQVGLSRHPPPNLPPGGEGFLALAPGANWPCKQWPVAWFAELAKKLSAEGSPLANASILVIAEGHEREQIRPLLQSIPANKLIEIIGRDLLTVAACLKQCQLFVGNDSGLMHVAAAMGTPTLGLFGPGYEEIYGPWGAHCAFVRTDESREELLARLPNLNVREPNLMGGLSVEKVYAAATALIARTR